MYISREYKQSKLLYFEVNPLDLVIADHWVVEGWDHSQVQRRWPLYYVHSDMMVFSAQLAKGGGAHPCTPFNSIYPLSGSYVALSTLSPARLARESYLCWNFRTKYGG